MNSPETKDLTNVKDLESHDMLITYLNNIGGCFTIEDAVNKLGMSEEEIKADIEKGTLIGMEINGEMKIPAFQIHSFKKLEGLEDILLSLGNMENKDKILFLNEPAKYLKGKTPAYVLKKQKSVKDIEKVKKATLLEKEAHEFIKEGKPSAIKGLKEWSKDLQNKSILPTPLTSRLVLN